MKLLSKLFGLIGRKKATTEFSRRSLARTAKYADADRKLVMHVSGSRIPTFRQMKHLPRYLSAREKRVVAGLLLVGTVSLVVLGVKYLATRIVDVPTPGGEYREASVGGPRFVNPVLAGNNDADLDIIRLVFSGLMKTDAEGHIVPDLAASYEISEDGRIYTFTLRDDVAWHDGTALAANDVLATFDAIRHPAWKSPLAAQFRNVAVHAEDFHTVVFTLQEPFAPFLSLLTVGIVPQHLWQDVKPENVSRAELNIKPKGTGPYMFKELAKDAQGAIRTYTLVRNPNYYGDTPNIETVIFEFFPDFGSAADALMKRRVDGMSFLPLDYRDDIQEIRGVNTYTPRLPQYTAIFFDQERNPALTDKRVRQALAYGLDKNRILDESVGYAAVPVHGPILQGFVGFHPDIKKYGLDTEVAAKLLDDAGWTANAEGQRTKRVTEKNEDGDDVTIDKVLTVTLTTVDAKENLAVAQAIKNLWEGIGVMTELDIVPGSAIQKDIIRDRNYEALLYGEIFGADPDPYPFWHSSQNKAPGLNLAVFSNAKVDSLLETARTTTDAAKRSQMYVEFQDILAEEVPTIFLYSPTYTFAVSNKVKGIATGTIFSPADRFSDIEHWYITTRKTWK